MSKTSEALSEWGMSPVHAVEVFPLEKPFDVSMALPGSKSFTNRALVLAAVAKGPSTLISPLFSDDSYWCCDALSKLGVNVRAEHYKDRIVIGNPLDGKLKLLDAQNIPYIGSAGTIARFLPGVIAARGEGDITLTSSGQLARRPVHELIKGLRALGAEISMEEGKSFPMTIKGGSLIGGEAAISGSISSQFISGLLIAAPLAKKPVTIKITDHIVQEDYVRITLSLMKDFGVDVEHDERLREFRIQPQDYKGREIQLEADASTATYFFAIAAATKSKVTITNLNPQTLQPDFGFVKHLEALGCAVAVEGNHVSLQGPEKLNGNMVFNFNDCSDSTPALAAIAPFADGFIKVEDVAHIRSHESDRIAVMAQTLQNAHVPVVEFEDGLTIGPTEKLPDHVVVDPHDDHRMAMSFSVMAAAANGATILDPSCVSKTCSNFFELLALAGVKYAVTEDAA
ncbi:MAG: 3-phosphoshikimate 1-carboxyvinyltransferase [Micavibrio aeruginosavorus]|uniref:3-phosphoshikimate 1-carboxyvinyltransferase n=1 Tax=Micavibrio aeruginosavorus TaxID=349221 RepID=A0A2W5MT67_9BACT|nr:MAG: 3-phosphoshikimate 1-carboxyvinyltransferase [Micavibrio aeruginosavorus]